MTNDEILNVCGSKKPLLKNPYWRKDGANDFHETLTMSGSKSYESLRHILIELESRGVLTFNEDKLDKEFYGI